MSHSNQSATYLYEQGFMEAHSPRIIGSATEGGAELFSIDYFEQKAYLAQSPQLYKEELTLSFEKVFEVGPFFRAEESHTRRHLSEFTSVDVEVAFADAKDVMALLEQVVHNAFKVVKEKCTAELALLQIRPPSSRTPIQTLNLHPSPRRPQSQRHRHPLGRRHLKRSLPRPRRTLPGLLLRHRLAHTRQSLLHQTTHRQTRSQRRLRPHVELHRTNLRRHPHQRQKPTHRAPKRERPQPRQLQDAPTSLRLRHAPTRRLGNRIRTPNNDAHWH